MPRPLRSKIPTAYLAGPVGAGKTPVAIEMGRLLEAAGARAVIVDLDWLGWGPWALGPSRRIS